MQIENRLYNVLILIFLDYINIYYIIEIEFEFQFSSNGVIASTKFLGSIDPKYVRLNSDIRVK